MEVISGVQATGHQCQQEKDKVKAQLELELVEMLEEAEQVQGHHPEHQRHPQAVLGRWYSQQATGALLVDGPLPLDPVHPHLASA